MNLPIALFGALCFIVFVTSILLISEYAVNETNYEVKITNTIECNVNKGTWNRLVERLSALT